MTWADVFLAAFNSSFSLLTASEYTTKSTPSGIFSAFCSYVMIAPSDANVRVSSVSVRSEPLTSFPSCKHKRAKADTPIPPIPMQCTFLIASVDI